MQCFVNFHDSLCIGRRHAWFHSPPFPWVFLSRRIGHYYTTFTIHGKDAETRPPFLPSPSIVESVSCRGFLVGTWDSPFFLPVCSVLSTRTEAAFLGHLARPPFTDEGSQTKPVVISATGQVVGVLMTPRQQAPLMGHQPPPRSHPYPPTPVWSVGWGSLVATLPVWSADWGSLVVSVILFLCFWPQTELSLGLFCFVFLVCSIAVLVCRRLMPWMGFIKDLKAV